MNQSELSALQLGDRVVCTAFSGRNQRDSVLVVVGIMKNPNLSLPEYVVLAKPGEPGDIMNKTSPEEMMMHYALEVQHA